MKVGIIDRFGNDLVRGEGVKGLRLKICGCEILNNCKLNFDYFKVWGFPYKLWNVKTQKCEVSRSRCVLVFKRALGSEKD